MSKKKTSLSFSIIREPVPFLKLNHDGKSETMRPVSQNYETVHRVIFGQILPMKPSIFTKWFTFFPREQKK